MDKIKSEKYDMNLSDEEQEIIKHVSFFDLCSSVVQDLSGHSSALRFICQKDNQKYFVKIYKNNRIDDIKYIDKIYASLQIPTAKVIELVYLKQFDRTLVVYEFIEGKTLLELTKYTSLRDLEDIGRWVGKYLSKFKTLKCNEEEIKYLFEKELETLIENLYYMKKYYDKNGTHELFYIDLEKMCNNFNEYKKYIYATKVSFIHKDINLNNILVKNDDV